MSTMAPQSQPHAVIAPRPKGMLIDGQWVEAASGQRFSVENPAKRMPIVNAEGVIPPTLSGPWAMIIASRASGSSQGTWGKSNSSFS